MKLTGILTILGALVLGACATGGEESAGYVAVRQADSRPARPLFGAAEAASEGRSQAFGGYARGCLAGAEQLPETGPTWQAMRLSRNRNWAHPAMVEFLQDLSRFAATQPGWEGLYIGDISQPRGGPVRGHASHQIGMDADVWMLPPARLDLSRGERENLSAVSLRRERGAYVNDLWTEQNWAILREAASDPRVARIFLFPGAVVWMCDNETGNRDYLRRIRPWYGHDAHFHVRLNCPSGSPGCIDQDPPPPGDGCDQAREWQANILNPPPPTPPDPNAPAPAPRGELTLADLPQQCTRVLSSGG